MLTDVKVKLNTAANYNTRGEYYKVQPQPQARHVSPMLWQRNPSQTWQRHRFALGCRLNTRIKVDAVSSFSNVNTMDVEAGCCAKYRKVLALISNKEFYCY